MFKRISYLLPSLSQCWVIVFFLIILGGTVIGGIAGMICTAMGYNMADMNPLVSYLLPMIAPFGYILWAKGKGTVSVPLEASDFGKIPAVAAYLLMSVAMVAIGYISEPLSSWLPMPEAIKLVFEKILSNSVWAFLATVVAAPVIEEFLLRGIMERGMLYHSTPKKAILWSAFFFAVIHLNPWQAIGAFIAGSFLGWVYWRTHSLLACIFIHAVNNGMAYLLQLMYPNMPADSTYKDLMELYSPYLYYIVFVIFVVSLALILIFLDKKLPVKSFKPTRNI